jgi:hypothetical protein
MISLTKGYLTYVAARRFGKMPKTATQNNLEKDGWKFESIRASDGESPGQGSVHRIIHPDGKPLEGVGSPGYVAASDGPGIVTEPFKAVHEKRWQDFRNALQLKA